MPSKNSVKDALHLLRDEHFRRRRNTSGRVSNGIQTTRIHDTYTSSIPFGLIHHSDADSLSTPERTSLYRSSPTSPSLDSAEWRSHALALVIGQTMNQDLAQTVPAFTLLLLRHLYESYSGRALRDLIPRHLVPIMIRDCAARSPLSQRDLNLWYETDGHVGHETIIVGPAQPNPDWLFKQENRADDDFNWECSPDFIGHSGVIWMALSTNLPLNDVFLRLPPSLTHLGLVDIFQSVPLWRLTHLCPLLVVLDISYNKWINSDDITTVAWNKWTDMITLGLRGYDLHTITQMALVRTINKRRWNDIDVVLQ